MSTKTLLAGLALAFLAGLVPATTALAEEQASARFDGLVPVKDARVAMAYIDPDADFSAFSKVMILEPFVAFRSNWQRDQNRSRSRNVRTSDMERIKADVASMFRDVFIEQLQADHGLEVVNEPGEDVLLLRPAIIDLDISAPDTRSSGRSRTYSASAGAATLYMELFDSMSGDIIGRAADRRVARQGGMMTWNNRVTNSAEARRMFRRWADKLREFLDQHYVVKDQK
jgi:Protein of unknown function (DUF3313)